MSTRGLLTELAIGAGEAADAPISGVRAIAAAVGQTRFTDALVILLRRSISNAQDLPRFAAFISKLASDNVALQASKQIFTSQDLLAAGITAHDEIGDAFFAALKSIGERAKLGGIKSAQDVTSVLGSLSPKVRAALSNSASFPESMEGLARAIQYGGLDPEMARVILSNSFFTKAYSQADLLVDIGAVAKTTGFPQLAKRLRVNSPQNFGFLYELQVAAHFAEEGGTNLTAISKFVKAQPPLTQTEVDLIINGTYYQVKRSTNAFLSGSSEQNAAAKTLAWITKAKLDGAESIKYVTQPDVVVPGKIQNLLDAMGIEVIRIPGS